MKKRLTGIFMAAFLALASMAVPLTSRAQRHVLAEERTDSCGTSYEGSNVNAQDYIRAADVVKSYLSVKSDGYMRVQAGDTIDGIYVEYYDKQFQYNGSRNIAKELPIFGGFYETESNYYVVTGQENPNESETVEVFRITKYDKNWNKIKSVGLYGENTTIPFRAGSLRMASCGKYLLIRTSHQMYTSSDQKRHQASVTIEVDTQSMTVTDRFTKVMNVAYGYVSHSFNQFLAIEQNRLITVDHGDAYPRSIVLLKNDDDVSDGTFSGQRSTATNIMTFPGAIGENRTGASVGGFEISDTSYLIAGNSVVQDEENISRTTRNIFVAAQDKQTGKVSIHRMTNFAEGEKETVSTPHLVKAGNNKYMLLWSQDEELCYALLNDKGEMTGTVHKTKGALSDCAPQLAGGKIVWYTWTDDEITFYELNCSELEEIKKTVVNPGHSFEVIRVTDGLALLRCSKCGLSSSQKVAQRMSIGWNTTGVYSSYSTFIKDTFSVGECLYYWNWEEIDEDRNSQLEIKCSDPDVVTWKKVNNDMGYFIMNKAGTATIEISYKWNPALTVKKNITVTTPTGEIPTEKPNLTDYKRGDVDKNGKVDLRDAQIALKAALFLIDLDSEQRQLADVDKNQSINLSDAQMILKAALFLIKLE